MSARHTDLVRQHQQELNARDTDDLVALWQERDAGSLTAEGMEAVRRLLLVRQGYLPPDPVAAVQRAPATPAQPGRRDAPDAVPIDRQPIAAPRRLVQISAGAQIFSWVYLVGGLIAALIQAFQAFNGPGWTDNGFTIVVAGLTALQAGFFFVVLQLMAEGVLLALGSAQTNRRTSVPIRPMEAP